MLEHLAGHAGTSPIVSQTVLTLLFVVLGLSIVAFAFGRMKSAENLKLHRVIMSSAIILLLIPIFLVMLPTTYTFYTDPDVEYFSPISILTSIHGIVGLPVVVLGLTFLTNDLPGNVKKWMQRTSALLVLSVGLGVLLFLTMLDIISFGGM
jgi:hypothetical protein